jgi:hypothetical protein
MKRSLLAIAALTAALTFSGAATAAPSPSQQIKALAKRVTALEKKVKTLETENRNLRGLVGATFLISVCSVSLTADALQGTWAATDTFAQQSTTPKTIFGPQTAVSDPANACAELRVTRTPVQANVAPFSALLALLA